jgi:hypothetical protein
MLLRCFRTRQRVTLPHGVYPTYSRPGVIPELRGNWQVISCSA